MCRNGTFYAFPDRDCLYHFWIRGIFKELQGTGRVHSGSVHIRPRAGASNNFILQLRSHVQCGVGPLARRNRDFLSTFLSKYWASGRCAPGTRKTTGVQSFQGHYWNFRNHYHKVRNGDPLCGTCYLSGRTVCCVFQCVPFMFHYFPRKQRFIR